MATSTTLEQLLQGIHSKLLDEPCSDEDVLIMYKWITKWKEISPELRLSEIDEEVIMKEESGVLRQNLKMLRIWRQRFADQATYQKLANAFFSSGNNDLVKKLADLLRAKASQSTHNNIKAPICPKPSNGVPRDEDLQNEVAAEVPAKWRCIGIQLDLSSKDLDDIQSQAAGMPNSNMLAFELMFAKWKSLKGCVCSWSAIIKALEAPAVMELKLATNIKAKFYSSMH